ncbi:MAG: lamin tail domain-containing protein [Planctomycetes bacterium]|nr:lamin tail domain-containing protein [Planctomycetota bacterium]
MKPFRLSIRHLAAFSLLTACVCLLEGNVQASHVVINEIHYNPDVKTEPVEFVELYNSGPENVDLTGWTFSDGILYRFQDDTLLPAHDYMVVACDPATVLAKYTSRQVVISPQAIQGPFEGKLDNEGEAIELRNPVGDLVDQVDYQSGFPWPTVGDAVPYDGQPAGTGSSIQLVHPDLDNEVPGNWRSSLPTPGRSNETVYATNAPPHIRQVKHQPQQPMSEEAVTVSVKVTDPDGVTDVFLSYQIVEPGGYLRVTDTPYDRNWVRLDIVDNGLQAD